MITEYFRAENLEQAHQKVEDGATILGGGGYISKHQEGIDVVVDLQKIGLTGIEVDDQYLRIGASVKLQTLLDYEEIPISLKQAILRFPGSLNIRNSSTIAGSILMSDGRFDLLPWFLSAEAEIETYPDNNRISLENFIKDFKRNASKSIITNILIPRNANVIGDVVARAPKDAILVGMFINRKSTNNEMRICVCGQDLYPVCMTVNNSIENKRELILENIKNAHSQFGNKFCSFPYFVLMCEKLFDRIIGGEL
jgi:CO/xanthine dehydrogenase FAD-binding subunit